MEFNAGIFSFTGTRSNPLNIFRARGYAVDSHAYWMWWFASNLPVMRKALVVRGLGPAVGLAPPKA